MSNTINKPNVLNNYHDQAPKTGERYQKVLDDTSESILNAYEGNLYNDQVDQHLDIIEYLIINNPEKVGKHLDSFFFAADKAKERMDYETANELWGVLFDYALKDPSAPISFEYEYADFDPSKAPSEWFKDKEEISEWNYHGLAVLKYNDYFLNIPAPLLSADALNIFLRFARPVERHNHRREHALNPYLGFEYIAKKFDIVPTERVFDDDFFERLTEKQKKEYIENDYYDEVMDKYLEKEQLEKVSR